MQHSVPESCQFAVNVTWPPDVVPSAENEEEDVMDYHPTVPGMRSLCPRLHLAL
jgi:hypothetical protein